MHQTHPSASRRGRTRAMALLLALALLLGFVPGLDLGGGGSAHWSDAYLSQLIEWDFVRPDQVSQPDKQLTRADFMAITNRAYGYSDQGPTPFEDIKESDWFYDDVEIAYTNKYIKGTSETTASPNDTLTRETAATILGRNMMMQESAGEILDFTDARDISFWSKGVIKSSLEHYLVGGYDDGTFRPQRSVTWGEMAAMLTRIVGTPLQEPGDYSLGGVFGNVTITSPGVTLRDTVVSGDLYITGGVGLGDIKLENVTVLGRVICSGTGEAESGQASIILRNVTADELLIDNLQGKTVSVQADGITEIGRTTVRTSAYIEDNTPDGLGLHGITLEAHPMDEEDEDAGPPSLTLAGRIESVVNKTPESFVHVAKGTVGVLTIDEAAVDSHVTIDRNAEVKELNLDTATLVDGEGDIKHLNVNAPDCEVTILPEEIYIRPGIIAEINGEEMDNAAGEASNREPQILSGYPAAEDIAPTTITAVFAANKKGTIYWAISPISSGSVGVDDLIKPPVYGGISVAHGSVAVPEADEEVRSAVKGLTPGGSFYLSAVMVDERGVQSTVKVISFSTPDNTKPAFCQGYPYMSSTSAKTGCQVVVMPTKTCNLYYALMPSGAKAPTEAEFKSGAITGALGYGMAPVTKNTESVFRVDDVTLEEQKEYVLYLWLVDADGANSSKVTSLKFTTKDETPPFFIIPPTPNKVQATSVGLNFRLSEDGTVFWAVVPAGTEYPKKQPGKDTINLSDDWAKLQVQSGANAFKSGKVSASEGKDGTINVSGLDKETAYDLYYVAQDKAGNFSVMVQKVVINTLDESGPKIRQYFSKYDGTDETKNPMPATDIILEFTENVRYSGENGGEGLLELYKAYDEAQGATNKADALARLVTSVRGSITLWREDSSTGQNVEVTHRYSVLPGQPEHTENANWVIDYEQVKVEMRDGKMLVTFPESGLNLDSGATYYFTIHDLTDTSTAQNPLAPSTVDYNAASVALGHNVPKFTTVFADVFLSDPGVRNGEPYERRAVANANDKPKKSDALPVANTQYVGILDPSHADPTEDATPATVDMHFQVTPRATKTVEDNISYDILIWTDTTCTYDLYYRILDKNGNPVDKDTTTPAARAAGDDDTVPAANRLKTRPGYEAADDNGWVYLGYSGDLNVDSTAEWEGKTVNGHFNRLGNSEFPALKNMSENLRYEFAISLRSIKGSSARATWTGKVNMKVQVAAGWSSRLHTLSQGLNWKTTWPDFQNIPITAGGVQSVGKDAEGHFYFDIFQLFTDTRLPVFATNSPSFATTSDSVTMSLALDRKGTIYYAVGKAEISPSNKHPAITTTYQNTTIAGDTDHEVSLNPAAGEPKVPRNGPEDKQFAGMTPAQSVNAEPYDITNPLNQYIFNPQGWSDAMVAVATDHIENPGGALSTPVVKDLEPNTTYYVYFVLKGTAQEISRVYVYQFTTEPIRPPKITDLSPISGGDARTETDVNSLMDYRVFNAVEAGIPGNVPILQAKLNDAGNHNELNIPAPYTDYTILQALTTPFDIAQVSNPGVDNVPTKDGVPDVRMKDYTVFDIYASADAKRHVYNMILNGSTSGEYAPDMEPIDEGHNLKIKGTTPTTLELKDIKPGGTYLIVTMARNELSDENASVQDNFSFRAAERIGIVDQEAPKIDRFAGGSANPDRPSTSPTSQTYSGSFSIIFNTDIYWRQDANHRHYPAGGEDKFDADGNPTEKNILTNATINPKSSTVTASTTSVPTKIFTFNFEHMENNGSIIIEGGNLCNSSGQLANDNLVITFKEDATRFYAIAEWGSSKSEIELYTKPPMEMNLVSTSGVILTPKGTNYALTLNTGNTDNSSTILASLVPASNEYKFTWTGANQNVVTVDLDGSNNETAKITAVGVGKTTITVSTAGGAALKTIDVTVQAGATRGAVTADKTSVTFKAGDTTPKTVKLTTSPELGQAVVKTINPTTPAYESTLQKTSATTYSLKITPKKVTRKTTAKLQISAGGKKVEEITVTVNPTKN
ncbi:MAG: hypothetical protein HFF62_02450 [Oscillospiraceae bacterium]|nr:hypothetical protein [Oscillospiraceae bacterium]